MTKALLLVGTMNSVKEVAYSLGFKQVSHFCREFKTFHGLTCGEYAACLSVVKRRWGKRWQCIIWTRKGKLVALVGRGCRSRATTVGNTLTSIVVYTSESTSLNGS
jgi:hypothetical protein